MKLDEDTRTALTTVASVDLSIGCPLVLDYHHMPAWAVAVFIIVMVLSAFLAGVTLGRAREKNDNAQRRRESSSAH